MAERALRPGFLGGGSRKWQFLGFKENRSDYEKIFQLMATGKVRAVIGERFSFEDVPAAWAKLKEGSGVGGKVVIDVVKE